MAYHPTIGLEIHIELATATKMFCGCRNDPEETRPNYNVCPVCLGHPGALPTINQEAIESTIKLGLALGGEISGRSRFDRKSYFYPDLPKGYQISQYEHPLVKGGVLNGVHIRRIHLEEDTGRLVHANNGHERGGDKETAGHSQSSLVDFNRAGISLVELVTEPDIQSGAAAVAFGRELQLIIRYLGISSADMERGQMRVEANISISRSATELGTKVEVKNLNSFRAVGDAIEYELKRQAELLDRGERVKQETRGWDEGGGLTKSQRSKEEAHDYRYLPEPDLPELDLSDEKYLNLELLKRELPELPEAKRIRFAGEFHLSAEQAALVVSEPPAARFFEETVSELETENVKRCCMLVFNYLTSDLFGLIKERSGSFATLKITPENFADLVALVEKDELSSRMAKDVLAEMYETGEDPRAVMERRGMRQVHDAGLIETVVEEVIGEAAKAVADYKKGNENSFQFLIGATMKKLRGQGNPEAVKRVLKRLLG